MDWMCRNRQAAQNEPEMSILTMFSTRPNRQVQFRSILGPPQVTTNSRFANVSCLTQFVNCNLLSIAITNTPWPLPACLCRSYAGQNSSSTQHRSGRKALSLENVAPATFDEFREHEAACHSPPTLAGPVVFIMSCPALSERKTGIGLPTVNARSFLSCATT